MNTLKRRQTHQVQIDHLIVGSDAPVVVQSMTNTDTADAEATALQVKELSDAGSEMRSQVNPHFPLPVHGLSSSTETQVQP